MSKGNNVRLERAIRPTWRVDITLAASRLLCRGDCHRRAGWPGPLKPNKEQRFPNRNAAYLKDGPDAPGLLHKFDYTNAIFQDRVTLDAMWAISDRAYYPPADTTAQ